MRLRPLVLLLLLALGGFSQSARSAESKEQAAVFAAVFAHARQSYRQGDYKAAAVNFVRCTQYYQGKDNERYLRYLRCLYYLALSAFHKGDATALYQLCTVGKDESLQLGNRTMQAYFDQIDGLMAFNDQHYPAALKKLQNALPVLQRAGDTAQTALTQLYIGRSYWASGNHKAAVPWLKAVARLSASRQHWHPTLRTALDLLIDHYHNQPLLQQRYLDARNASDQQLARDYPQLFDPKNLPQALRQSRKQAKRGQATCGF